ncbi:hypothetical protein D9M71_678610 [compost metagenome]
MDTVVQAALIEEVTVGLGRSGETAGYGNTRAGEVADHLAQGGILAPYVLDVMVAELIEGNYVLCQGDFSPKVCAETAFHSNPCLWPGPGK